MAFLNCRHDLLGIRTVSSFVLRGGVNRYLRKPLDSKFPSKIIYGFKGGATRSCGANDNLATDFHEIVQASEKTAVWITLALDSNFHIVNRHDDGDVHSDMQFFNYCSRI